MGGYEYEGTRAFILATVQEAEPVAIVAEEPVEEGLFIAVEGVFGAEFVEVETDVEEEEFEENDEFEQVWEGSGENAENAENGEIGENEEKTGFLTKKVDTVSKTIMVWADQEKNNAFFEFAPPVARNDDTASTTSLPSTTASFFSLPDSLDGRQILAHIREFWKLWVEMPDPNSPVFWDYVQADDFEYFDEEEQAGMCNR